MNETFSTASSPAGSSGSPSGNGSFPSSLWVIVLVSPSGFPAEYKIRAPSEQQASDRIIAIKGTDWRVATDHYGNPLIHREELRG